MGKGHRRCLGRRKEGGEAGSPMRERQANCSRYPPVPHLIQLTGVPLEHMRASALVSVPHARSGVM